MGSDGHSSISHCRTRSCTPTAVRRGRPVQRGPGGQPPLQELSRRLRSNHPPRRGDGPVGDRRCRQRRPHGLSFSRADTLDRQLRGNEPIASCMSHLVHDHAGVHHPERSAAFGRLTTDRGERGFGSRSAPGPGPSETLARDTAASLRSCPHGPGLDARQRNRHDHGDVALRLRARRRSRNARTARPALPRPLSLRQIRPCLIASTTHGTTSSSISSSVVVASKPSTSLALVTAGMRFCTSCSKGSSHT